MKICKDKTEAEVWIAGLKSLLSSGQGGRSKIDGWSDGGLCLDVSIHICCLCSFLYPDCVSRSKIDGVGEMSGCSLENSGGLQHLSYEYCLGYIQLENFLPKC